MKRVLLGAVGLAGWSIGCFGPSFADGTIACGDAGCPPGMTCADDGLCYAQPPGHRAALAIASSGGNDRVYAYCDGALREVWRDDAPRTSVAAAWGDADGDGVPELAIASDEDGVALYAIGGGGLERRDTRAMPAPVRALAWGDFDGDGRDDLAAAGADAMHLLAWYRDRGLDTWWDSYAHEGLSIAAADTDGDGVAEIALGTRGESVIVFGSDGQGGLDRVWAEGSTSDAAHVAWEGDGRARLAVANPGDLVRVYAAHHGRGYDLDGASPAPLDATAAAWGPGGAIAVGTVAGEPVHVLASGDLSDAWTSPETDPTTAIAWADVDGDGVRDLIVGNAGAPDRWYRGSGGGGFTLAWSSPGDERTRAVAWASWDGGPDPCGW